MNTQRGSNPVSAARFGNRAAGSIAALALCAALTACGSGTSPVLSTAMAGESPTAATGVAEGSAVSARKHEERAALRRANAAYHANHIVAPVDDNAIVHALHAREINADSVGATELLTDIMPIATAQVQGMIAAGNLPEADRAIALLRQVNPDSITALSLQRRLAVASKPESATPTVGGTP